MKKLLGAILASIILLTASSAAYAGGSSCEPLYSGGQTCPTNVTFTINKLVQNPNKGGSFVENLTLNDPTFNVGQNVNYEIKIKNTGNTTINSMTVVDTLPVELTFVGGAGSFDSSSNTLTFTVNGLEAGKEATYFITTKVVNISSNNCPVNFVRATADTGATAQDQASFCLSQNVPQVMTKPMIKQTPATGPETDILFGLVSTGALGMLLRKKSN